MKPVAPYLVDVIDATPAEVDTITRGLADTFDAPVIVQYRPRAQVSDRVVRNRLIAAGVVLLLAAGVGMCGPLWNAMPWYVAP